MDILDAIRNRRSIRAYAAKPVERDKIERMLEAARLAPSAANRQPWRFVLVTEPERRAALASAAVGQEFIADAPLIIVACAEPTDHDVAPEQSNYPIDVTIALNHAALQAVAEGLGTCWITGFYAAQVKKILDIPPEIGVIQMLIVGYPAGPPRPFSRLPLEKIARWETW
ncbi:MAG: nitroreductase family protein [Planctomycetota bacterium]|jgi:nitroreductase